MADKMKFGPLTIARDYCVVSRGFFSSDKLRAEFIGDVDLNLDNDAGMQVMFYHRVHHHAPAVLIVPMDQYSPADVFAAFEALGYAVKITGSGRLAGKVSAERVRLERGRSH